MAGASSSAGLPRISVITVSYNQAQYLPDAIETVLKQNYPDFEHIVVDGGSKDNSREVCARYPHLQFIELPNSTQSECLNLGFEKATGDIIAWVNSDDYYEPGVFHLVAREMRAAPDRNIVCGAAKVVNADGGFMWILPNGRVPFFRLLFHPRLYPHNGWMVMPCQPSVFFRREVYAKIGPLEPKLRRAMDYEYWLRMMSHGYRFHYVPRILSDYRYHQTSHSNQGFDTFLDEWKAVSKRYYDALPGWKKVLGELWWLYARVECEFVKRHKAALQHMAVRLGHNPSAHPRHKRWLVMLRACAIAPWLPVLFAKHLLQGGTYEQQLMARTEPWPAGS